MKIHKWKKILQMGFALSAMLLAATGCTIKYGGVTAHNQFVYPNSNVRILGPAKATYTKTTLFVSDLGVDNIRNTYAKALEQQSGANVLVNLKEDTTTTMWLLPIITTTYTVEGDAAVMQVGKQELK